MRATFNIVCVCWFNCMDFSSSSLLSLCVCSSGSLSAHYSRWIRFQFILFGFNNRLMFIYFSDFSMNFSTFCACRSKKWLLLVPPWNLNTCGRQRRRRSYFSFSPLFLSFGLNTFTSIVHRQTKHIWIDTITHGTPNASVIKTSISWETSVQHWHCVYTFVSSLNDGRKWMDVNIVYMYQT